MSKVVSRSFTGNLAASSTCQETLSLALGVCNMLRRACQMYVVVTFTPTPPFIRELPQGDVLDIAAPLFTEFSLENATEGKKEDKR